LCLSIVIWIKGTRNEQILEQHSITPEALHTLLASNPEIVLLDVRQPLDLLADAEIIPGSKRVPPREVLKNPSLIPRDKDAVLTVPVLHSISTVLALNLQNVLGENALD
jgi:hypothetical protein